ncbi:MAG: tetratricopeptide repeat protein [Synechococcales cyanobacterium RM1_1_8]|nr:tetratricopeptide repeat protein [Synechococcales cyanobacterium RM1_1_8]
MNRNRAIAPSSNSQAASPQTITAETCCQQGKAHCQAGEFAAALAAFDQAIALDPRHAPAHNNRGNALGELQRQAEALAAYERALALAPTYHRAWFNKGQLLTQLGAYGNALEAYGQAIQLQPDPIYLHAQAAIWQNRKLVTA